MPSLLLLAAPRDEPRRPPGRRRGPDSSPAPTTQARPVGHNGSAPRVSGHHPDRTPRPPRTARRRHQARRGQDRGQAVEWQASRRQEGGCPGKAADCDTPEAKVAASQAAACRRRSAGADAGALRRADAKALTAMVTPRPVGLLAHRRRTGHARAVVRPGDRARHGGRAGGWTDTSTPNPWGILVGFVLGFAAAVLNVVRITRRAFGTPVPLSPHAVPLSTACPTTRTRHRASSWRCAPSAASRSADGAWRGGVLGGGLLLAISYRALEARPSTRSGRLPRDEEGRPTVSPWRLALGLASAVRVAARGRLRYHWPFAPAPAGGARGRLRGGRRRDGGSGPVLALADRVLTVTGRQGHGTSHTLDRRGRQPPARAVRWLPVRQALHARPGADSRLPRHVRR